MLYRYENAESLKGDLPLHKKQPLQPKKQPGSDGSRDSKVVKWPSDGFSFSPLLLDTLPLSELLPGVNKTFKVTPMALYMFAWGNIPYN